MPPLGSTNVKSKGRRTKIDRQNRMDRVGALLTLGANYDEIARTLGVSTATVSRDVQKLMEQWRKNSLENTDEIVRMELRRLDEMMRGIYPNAKAGDMASLDRMLKIMERRARLLGLDAPAKIAPTDPSGMREYNSLDGLTDEQIKEQLAHLGRLAVEIATAESIDRADGDATSGDDPQSED